MTISFKDVSKVYPNGVEAVASASSDIGEGEFVSILGPSGCGKSTLMMMLAGLENPSTGAISINNLPVAGPRRDVGLVFQEATLLPWLTARQNILFPIRMMKLRESDYAERADQLLAMAELADAGDRRPAQLSGGMRQRVALCRALIHNPSLMLMDEPFSALDAITRDEMGLVLLDLWQQAQASGARKMALFITHSIREAVLLSDRVLVMSRRPSTIIADIRIPFERPRPAKVQDSAAFTALVADLRDMIEDTIRGGGLRAT